MAAGNKFRRHRTSADRKHLAVGGNRDRRRTADGDMPHARHRHLAQFRVRPFEHFWNMANDLIDAQIIDQAGVEVPVIDVCVGSEQKPARLVATIRNAGEEQPSLNPTPIELDGHRMRLVVRHRPNDRQKIDGKPLDTGDLQGFGGCLRIKAGAQRIDEPPLLFVVHPDQTQIDGARLPANDALDAAIDVIWHKTIERLDKIAAGAQRDNPQRHTSPACRFCALNAVDGFVERPSPPTATTEL
jgi:hypothetical protein